MTGAPWHCGSYKFFTFSESFINLTRASFIAEETRNSLGTPVSLDSTQKVVFFNCRKPMATQLSPVSSPVCLVWVQIVPFSRGTQNCSKLSGFYKAWCSSGWTHARGKNVDILSLLLLGMLFPSQFLYFSQMARSGGVCLNACTTSHLIFVLNQMISSCSSVSNFSSCVKLFRKQGDETLFPFIRTNQTWQGGFPISHPPTLLSGRLPGCV